MATGRPAPLAQRALGLLLLLGGCLEILAFGAAAMPFDGMAGTHRALGLGELAETPIVEYLARTISLLYGLQGIVHLVVSRDIPRYLPLVRVLGAVNVVLGLAFVAVDLEAGLPWWWTALEGVTICGFGVVVLALVSRLPPGASERSRSVEH